MLKASARCTHFGLLWWIFYLIGVDGLIEIVEEQRCHDYEFRLTCRDLDNHIAVLEAWYTSLDDYHLVSNATRPPEALRIRTENDSELNRVYIYSSPKNNGVYETANHSTFENISNMNSSEELRFSNDSISLLNDTVDLMNVVNMGVEFLNDSESCGATTFARSYASWHEGDKRRRPVDRSLSINLRSPVSYRPTPVYNLRHGFAVPVDGFKNVTSRLGPRFHFLVVPIDGNLFYNTTFHIHLLDISCTGVNHCSFILKKDYNPAVRWSPGLVYIKYACFDDSVSLHYCNREVRIAESGPDSEGYIRTPGYPHFYIGVDECRWQLQSHPEQKIRITLVDVSLRSIGPFENQCTDYVTIQDPNGDELVSTCDQVELPLQVMSSGPGVTILVEARSEGAFPKRGVLLHYKSVGCVSPPAPSNGYLVYRNEDVAHYVCNVNYVFADTRERARVIWCYDDNRWNDTVPLCIEEKLPSVRGSDSTPGEKKDTKIPSSDSSMLVDIVIPSLLIAALFIGNAVIVLVIYKYRKRKTDDLDEEFNTIPLSNGAVHSGGNAV